MGRTEPGHFHAKRWIPPSYTVDDDGKVVGGYQPSGLHNWGRWGEFDHFGTANLITPESIVAAAGLVRHGTPYSLALPIDVDAPRWSGRRAPMHYFTMTGSDGLAGLPHSANEPGVTFTDDYIDMALQSSTQWDGLAHWAYQDSLYNGYWSGNITSAGSPDLDMSELKASFVGRGVLVDVPAVSGTPYLAPSTAITPEMLDEALAQHGVEIRSGDMLLVRTGHLGRWYTELDEAERRAWFTATPGLSRTVIPWLHEKDVSAVALDTMGVEVVPNEEPVDPPHPVHHAALIDMGLTLGELWWLEDLASACADDDSYEFLLCAPPLNIPGAIGSVLNPIAIK
jgi:kynurenine formamidase